MDITSSLERIWRDWEAKKGRRIPPAFRTKVVEMLGGDSNNTLKADLDASLGDYIELGEAWNSDDSTGDENEKAISPKGKGKSRGPYRKTFERRVYVATTVLHSAYAFREIAYPLATHEPIPKRRISWKALASKWNKANPSDQMKEDSLRSLWNVALRDAAVMKEVLRRWWEDAAPSDSTKWTFRDTWIHLVLTGGDKPMLDFLRKIENWQTTTSLAEVRKALKISPPV